MNLIFRDYAEGLVLPNQRKNPKKTNTKLIKINYRIYH